MTKFIIKRLLLSVVILFFVMFLIYTIMYCMPTTYVEKTARELSQKPGSLKSAEEWLSELNAQYGMDKGVVGGYFHWITNSMLTGDFGESWYWNVPVTQKFQDTVWLSFELGAVAFILQIAIAIPLGVIAARKQYSVTDYTVTVVSMICISMPTFWVGLLFQYVFGHTLRLLPISGFSSFEHLIMPAFVLGWSYSGSIARMTRTNLLEAMHNDYIRTARAKGLKESGVIRLHALKNAMMPVVTMMAMQVAGMLSGAVMTETIFSIPGLGRVTVDAIKNRDMPLLQGSTIFAAFLIILGNLVADIAYSFLDPRIRVS